jgi:hypothetical protein
MNSRDAMFEEQMQDILKASAVDAGLPVDENDNDNMDVDEEEVGNKKKRRRVDEDRYEIRITLLSSQSLSAIYSAPPKKRSRSASVASDKPTSMPPPREPTPNPPGPVKGNSAGPSSVAVKTGRGGRRGGKAKAVVPHVSEPVDSLDGEQNIHSI